MAAVIDGSMQQGEERRPALLLQVVQVVQQSRETSGDVRPDDAGMQALATAWERLDAAPDTFRAKLRVNRLLQRGRVVVAAERIEDLHRLLTDPAHSTGHEGYGRSLPKHLGSVA